VSLYIRILCKPFFSFSRHPSAFTVVQLPKITFIFYTILRFSCNRYYRTFHFIPPNLNQKNNMDKIFYPKYYNRLFQILFYRLDISLFLIIFFLFVYFHNTDNAFYLFLYQPLESQIGNYNYYKTKSEALLFHVILSFSVNSLMFIVFLHFGQAKYHLDLP
jgi:hypothetical protein